MSLKAFHLVFILIVMLGADLFGLWSVWNFVQTGDTFVLSLGIVCLLGGLGLFFYLVRLMRFFREAHIE